MTSGGAHRSRIILWTRCTLSLPIRCHPLLPTRSERSAGPSTPKSGRSPDELARDLSNADALIVRSATQVTRELMDAAPRLRVVARAGTGVDNVDVGAASDRGILVMNAAGANSVSVAEHALALLLSLARSVPAADASMKRGVWEKKKLTGTELRGKTLGIVGFGRIGREVALRARTFGMEILAHDPFISARAAEAAGVPLVALDDVLAQSDFLTLHVPALDQTRHLLNATSLARCRKGVRIVNTARGELIDEAALADAIESGHVAGAALDIVTKFDFGIDHVTDISPVRALTELKSLICGAAARARASFPICRP